MPRPKKSRKRKKSKAMTAPKQKLKRDTKRSREIFARAEKLLARGVTKRDYIVKFRGCYHGHADSFLSEAGSGLATLGIAECPGVPEALAALTINAPYNDLSSVEHLFTQHKKDIAAVIVEPIAANMGVVLPQHGFLSGLRELTRKHGALLIVDEVITGFRIHNGAVQQFLDVE